MLVALAVLLLAGACSGDDDSTSATPGLSSTTTSSDFEGDADSPFCRLVATAADRPVEDPFAAGLDPGEVEVRFRALLLQFREFAAVSPPELADDLDAMLDALDELRRLLDEAGYDFAAIPESARNDAPFDDPAFRDTAARLAIYREQVCQVR